jgi:predicted enzyme related to lactoylglutathione lyase
MPERTSYDPGTPCWVDVMTGDVEGVTAFCTDLFGWGVAEQRDEGGGHIYSIFTKDGATVAGLGGLPPGMADVPTLWNSYICVADAAATVAKIEPAGGPVHMPAMQVFDAGIMAVAADPTGAAFRLWQPLGHIGAGVVNEPNTYGWNELISSDVEAAKTFYAELFGWTYEGGEVPTGEYWVARGGESGGLAGLMGRPPGMPAQAPDSWYVYFLVSDLRATLEHAGRSGGQALFGPESVPGVGLIATLGHPVGGVFALMQPAAM